MNQFKIPDLDKLYQLKADLVREYESWSNGKISTRKVITNAGSIFKVSVIHYSQHSNYATLVFARKYNKDTPLVEATRFAITIEELQELVFDEVKV